MPDTIQVRFEKINERISVACQKAGRDRSEVQLIVVTKGHSAKSIQEVVKAGATVLGENYPEETMRKIEELNGVIRPGWHMIGHLQSRKIKLMYPDFACIHSLDSLNLADKINRYYMDKNSSIDVLIEINIAGEESKYGFDASSEDKRKELMLEIHKMSVLKHLHMVGLMTMPPYAETPSQNEACYNLCYEFGRKIQSELGLADFKQLSMGTSADFETAIKCGATYVRVGEAIMGPRNYPNKL